MTYGVITYGEVAYGEAAASGVVAGGTASETDTVHGLTVTPGSLQVNLGTAHETDTPRALTILQEGVPQTLPLGTAHETDTPLPLTVSAGGLTPALGTTHETDTPGSISAPPGLLSVSVGPAHETDTARTLFVLMPEPEEVTLGTAHETDTPHGLTVLTLTAVTNNRTGGRWRSGIGEAEWFPAVVTVPPPEAVDVALAFTVPTVDPDTGRVLYAAAKIEAPRHIDRIVVGGKDLTKWREQLTPLPGYSFVSPGGFGPSTLVVPQVHAAFERPGYGALRFLRIGAPVFIQRRDPDTGAIIKTDYRGIITAHNAAGREWSATVGGDLTGRAALLEHQVPIFRWKADLGRIAYDAVRRARRPFDPYLGPQTGIVLQRFGGGKLLEHLNQISAMSTTRTGRQWAIMPNWTTGRYGMTRRNLTTITATVYADDERTVARLDRDAGDEPNRIFMTGVTPEGLRVRFGRYPGLKMTKVPPPYPYGDNRNFGLGTEDADTDTGDGITILANRLWILKALTRAQIPGGYDADMVRAVKTVQRRAGITATGNMTPATWRIMYDVGAVGYSLLGSAIGPAAEDDRVRTWDRAPSGALIRRNPDFDRRVLPVERNVDAGTGFTIGQLKEWAEAEIEEGSSPNYVGSVTFNTGALIKGLHTPGDPITTADLFRARDLRPGMNLWMPLHSGGLIVHVSAVQVSAKEGIVSADVDTRARDSMAVWEVIARNREAKKSLRHAWVVENRASTQTKDSTTPWDEVGGVLPDPVDLAGDDWTVFPMVAGQEGTIGWLDVETNPNAEYVLAIFGNEIREARLRRLVPHPLTAEGSRRWASERIRRVLTNRDLLLYVAGSNKQPLGYYPKKKGGENDAGVKGAAPLTGRWRDEAQIRYYTGKHPVLYVAVYADRDTTIPRGRMAWPQLEAAT